MLPPLVVKSRRTTRRADRSVHPPAQVRCSFGATNEQPRRVSLELVCVVRGARHDTRVMAEARPNPEGTLWSGEDDRCLRLPQGQLLDAIADGELDRHLVAIADAVQARRELLHTVDSATALASLCVGDRVMFNRQIRPRYLEHELADITELDDWWVTVRLWRPVGRFLDRELRCPPLALKKLDRLSERSAASAQATV